MLYLHVLSSKVNTASDGFYFTTILRLACQLSPILHVDLDPLLLDRSRVQGIVFIVPHHLYVLNVKVHNVFQATSFPLMQSTVELELVAMNKVSNKVLIKKDHIGVQSDQQIRSIRVKTRLHLQIHADRMQVPLCRMFLVVFQFQQVPLPVFKLPALVFLKAIIWLELAALFHILRPCRCHKFALFLVIRAIAKRNHRKGDHSSSHYVLFGEDDTPREEAPTIDLINKIEQELAIAAQLALAERAAMLPTCGQLHDCYDQQHHDEIGHKREEAHPQSY